MVYVRQSSPRQVMENRESRERQYGLVDLARRLGWTPERIVVIDEDQGLSGRTAANRAGFQRLMAEVSLNHVGIVLGLELSRLGHASVKSTEVYLRADPSEKLEALEAGTAPSLRRGQFRAPDRLLAMLRPS